MNLEELLTHRFRKAIKKSFKPCPLIGDKWFSLSSDHEPPYFEFTGVESLSKATGYQPVEVAELIVKNMNMRDLDAEVMVQPEAGKIALKFKKPVSLY